MKHIPEIYLGLPSFGAQFIPKPEYPAGQVDCYRRILEQAGGDVERSREIIYFEYCSIASALMDMGEEFSVIRSYVQPGWEEMLNRFESAGFKFVDFPRIRYSRLLYPRDLAVYLPDGRTLFCYHLDYDFDLMEDAGLKVALSQLGEGGRILIGGGKALYPETLALEPTTDHEEGYVEIRRPGDRFVRDSGLEAIALPTPLMIKLPGNHSHFCNHLDLTMGLVVDEAGGAHLIVDPKMQAWRRDLSGFMSVGETLDAYRRACDQYQIELHIPSDPLRIPASLCFYRSPLSGKVLMTGGEDQVAEIIAGIIGEENIYTTSAPIRYYPTLDQAGIHCLIGELPPWMRQLDRYVRPEVTCSA